MNPALPRALTTLRQESEGSFSDSYLHQLSLSFKLVKLLGERFQVSFDGFSYVGNSLFAVLALADGTGKLNALCGIAAFRFLYKDNRELPAFDFNHKHRPHKKTILTI